MSSGASDEQLAMRAQKGMNEAFLELYDRYLAKVYNRVKSRVPLGDAEDVTQDVFVNVVRSLKNFEQRSRFNTWLYTIVNRTIADYYRKHYRRQDDQKVALEMDTGKLDLPTYEHNLLEDNVVIHRALSAMPDHYRDVILMRFADGLTFREIAESKGESLEATKSLYRRAIQAVRKHIGDEQSG
jgi:RNA polymerase sigma-70 factor (ECF subfamily)